MIYMMWEIFETHSVCWSEGTLEEMLMFRARLKHPQHFTIKVKKEMQS